MSNYTVDVVELDALWSEILDLSTDELDLELHSLGISLEKVDNSFAALERCAAFSSLSIELDHLNGSTAFIPVCKDASRLASLLTVGSCDLGSRIMAKVQIRKDSSDFDLRSKIPNQHSLHRYLHNN